MKKSIGQYIFIDPEDLPDSQHLKTTIDRLEKDIEVFQRLKNDKWPIEHLRSVLSYLKLLVQKQKERR